MIKRLTLDFETQSRCDLKKAGAWKYSLDPTTKPTCLAFKARGDARIHFLDYYLVNKPWNEIPVPFQVLWCDFIKAGYEISAHNIFFDAAIYFNILVKRYGWPVINRSRFRCTAAKAAACALPRNLEGAGSAMRLHIQKDKVGYLAMIKSCKPTKDNVLLTPAEAPEIFETLYKYCKIDVLAEESLDIVLPDLIFSEQQIHHVDQLMNSRGIAVDIGAVNKITDIMAVEDKIKRRELDKTTMGLVASPGARKAILDFLALDGIILPDLKAKTVGDILEEGKITGDAKTLLLLRKALSKTSTKKYQAFQNRCCPDGRVRDVLLYHGASTGRWGGTGVQPQNFPRGAIKGLNIEAAIADIMECDVPTLKLLYGENLSILFSAVLRGMFIPTKGMELFVADFAKIEVAVLWWLADHDYGLELLKSGRDPYIALAETIFRVPYDEVNEDQRALGKASILMCGFQAGAKRFRDTARDIYGLILSEKQAQLAVDSYREVHEPVRNLWYTYQMAAIEAVENRSLVKINHCEFSVKKFGSMNFLVVVLPSGRPLYYCDPSIVWVDTDFGKRKQLQYWAVNSLSKKWNQERTYGGKLTENIVQATARDLLAPAMLRLETAGYQMLLTVHDEVIAECSIGKGDIDEFISILCEVPEWGTGMPIEAKGFTALRYRK